MNSGPILNRRSRKIPPPQWHTFSPPLTPAEAEERYYAMLEQSVMAA